MVFKGRIYKEKKFWLVDFPLLGGVITQGHSKEEAHAMAIDWVRSMADQPKLNVSIASKKKTDVVYLSCSDSRVIIPLMLQMIRQSRGMTIMQVAEKLGSKSPTAYARYEQGKVLPSIPKLFEILDALEAQSDFRIDLAA